MVGVNTAIDFKTLWHQAISYSEFVEAADENRTLWQGVYRTARIPDWAFESACRQGEGKRLLAIVEDWCGDASNTVPILARLGDEAECLEMRVILREEHPAVMDQYLTHGSRSIPIVIVLDEHFRELGHWGPRPSELQEWVMLNKPLIPPDELYPQVRRWYAKDRGETTLREVLAVLNQSTSAPASA